jgi:cysteine-rich repeat protein
MQPRSCFLISLTSLLVLTACGAGEHSDGDGDLCGNGVLDPGETCDDGNRFDGDNCPSNCRGSFATFDVATNHCPELVQMSILPAAAPVGAKISLSALAKDPDGDPVSYDWTGTGGLLSHPLSSNHASYQCGYPGVHLLTLWIFDTHGCVTTAPLQVTCE